MVSNMGKNIRSVDIFVMKILVEAKVTPVNHHVVYPEESKGAFRSSENLYSTVFAYALGKGDNNVQRRWRKEEAQRSKRDYRGTQR